MSALALLTGLCVWLGCDAEHAPATTPTAHEAGARASTQALVGDDSVAERGPQTASKPGPEPASRRDAARAQLARRLGPLLQRDARQIAIETRAGGRTHVDLRGGFGHAVVARRDADGHLTIGCVDNLAQAERFFDLDGPTSTAVAP